MLSKLSPTEGFAVWLSANVLPQTQTGYRYIVERINQQAGGLLGDPTAVSQKLQQWYAGRRQALERKALKPGTLRTELTALRAFYKAMAEQGRFPADVPNPAAALKQPRRKRNEYLPRPMDRNDVLTLHQQIDTSSVDGLRDRIIIELFGHSLRRIEVVRANIDDVFFLNGKFQLRVHGKGNVERNVPLSLRLSGMFGVYLLRRFAPTDFGEWLAEFQDKPDPYRTVLAARALVDRRLREQDGPLFTHGAARVTERWLNRMFVQYRERAQLDPSYGPHSLRHTCATELLRANVPLPTVKELLGHARVETTMIYTQVANDLVSAGVEALPSATGGHPLWTK